MQRVENQDSMGYFTGPCGRLFVVCDGMGGHVGGRTASTTAVAAAGQFFESVAEGQSPTDVLANTVSAANQAIIQMGIEQVELQGMGTTCVALLVSPSCDQAVIGHVGDSRGYRVRDHNILRLTKDHSAVQKMVDDGLISQAQAPTHPASGVVNRTLGIDPDVEVETAIVNLREGDTYLLCSDGLTTMVDDEDICRYLREYPWASVGPELISLANARGGYDNITVQVVQVGTSRVVDGPSESGLARISDLLAEQETQRSIRRGRLLIAITILCLLVALLVALSEHLM